MKSLTRSQQPPIRTCALLLALAWPTPPSLAASSTTGQVEARDFDQDLEKDVWTADDHRLPELERRAVRIMQTHPDSAFAHYLLSHIYIRMFTLAPNDLMLLKQASELGQQAVDLEPSKDFGYVALAEVLDLMDSPQKAIQLLNQAMNAQIEPSWRGYFMLAKLYTDSQDSAKILALLDQALHFAGSQPDVIAPYIVAILQSSNHGNELIAKLGDWNKRFPNILFAQTIAMIHAEEGRHLVAHRMYQQIYARHPDFKEALINDAVLLYSRLNKAKEAIPLFATVISKHGDHMNQDVLAMVYAHQAAALLQLRAFIDAETAFTKAAIAAKSKDIIVEFASNTYRDGKNAQQLTQLLRRLNEEIPGQSLMHALLGEILSEDLADHKQATSAFANAILLEPERSDYYNGMGLVYYRMHKLEEALKLFSTATRVDPNDATARYNEACVLARLHKKSEALASLQEALILDPRLQETARQDTDFDGLRSTKEFTLLVSTPLKPSENSDGEDFLGH